MRTIFIFTATLFFLSSCSTSKDNNHNRCQTILYHADKLDYDTTKIKFLRAAYFDTTATLVHGNVADLKTNNAIDNALITMFNGREQYNDTTDEKREFEIFKNISEGQWNLKIVCSNYECVIINEIIHAGGQWYSFKLKHY